MRAIASSWEKTAMDCSTVGGGLRICTAGRCVTFAAIGLRARRAGVRGRNQAVVRVEAEPIAVRQIERNRLDQRALRVHRDLLRKRAQLQHDIPGNILIGVNFDARDIEPLEAGMFHSQIAEAGKQLGHQIEASASVVPETAGPYRS
jgi:hypothetical protein